MDEKILITTATVILLAILVSFLLLSFNQGGTRPQETIVLMGPTDSGKTYLLSKLYLHSTLQKIEKEIETVMSMEASSCILPCRLNEEGRVRHLQIVDLPGHPRLSWKLDEWIGKASVILYIIDSRCLPAHIKQVGEGLYHLLTQPSLIKRKTRVKILCNKSDLDDSKSAQQACSLLEKELDRIRASKSTDMLDQEDEEKEYLGYEGEVFSFDHLTTPVTWKSVSFKKDNVDVKFMFDLYQ